MSSTNLSALIALLATAAPGLAQGPFDEALAPRADWLSAASAPARWMPDDDFDWSLPPGQTVVLDTRRAVVPGTLALGVEETRIVQGGVLRVRNLYVPAGATLKAEGPNPLVILASGEVRVDGRITVDGGDAQSVLTLNTPTIPELGAPGHAGGGNGGTGSRLIDSTTPQGGPGNGAFNLAADGGQGGESGWHPDNSFWGWKRRAAGGGGGVFAADVVRDDGCLDQSFIGLDAEDGFPGEPQANSAVRLGEQLPWGGRKGRGPFSNGDTGDDFWGALVIDEGLPSEVVVGGEFPTPWAGAGGGAGGDATWTDTYPPPTLVNTRTDKGAGGGGGAGALLIFARGDVVLGPDGRLTADGGHGNGGENTNFVNRIGGGSGGGSGGHVIVQSLSQIDFSQVAPGSVAISARGGQGGQGNNGSDTPTNGEGGAGYGGETIPLLDAKHTGGPLDNPWIPPVPPECQIGLGLVTAAGGDGGPGVIQLHVNSLDDIVPPGFDRAQLAEILVPRPVGYVGFEFVGRLIPMPF